MKKLILFISILFVSLASFGQRYTVQESSTAGFFQVNGVDYPQGHFSIKYDGDIDVPASRVFTLYNIYDGRQLIASRYFTDVAGVSSWAELSELFNSLGAITSALEAGSSSTIVPYELQVTQGQVEGVDVVDKFGINPLVTTAASEDIWEFGGTYNYDADGTAPIQYVSSSSVNDTVTIEVIGLDVSGNSVTQTAKLDGQNNVTLSISLWRVFRMANESTVAIEGIAYCHTDPTPTNGVPAAVAVRAIINDGNNQTLMSLYTIPKDKVGFLYRGEVGVTYEGSPAALAEYATIQYQSRRYGKVFTVKKEFSLIVGGTSIHTDKRSFPDVIPELTDIKITAIEVSADMGLWATFDIVLYDKSTLPVSLVTVLGMTP